LPTLESHLPRHSWASILFAINTLAVIRKLEAMEVFATTKWCGEAWHFGTLVQKLRCTKQARGRLCFLPPAFVFPWRRDFHAVVQEHSGLSTR